ncbi:MAG TPA: aldose 1-epimerase [Acidimicrobiales bacterium]
MTVTNSGVSGISVSSGVLAASFVPELGMVGTSLRYRGAELLALPGGTAGYRAGRVTGLPLLAPWANRLGARRYEVDGVAVDLEALALPTDEHGLPIHGTMTAQPGWQVARIDARSLVALFDYGARRDLLASFPFPHTLRMAVTVEAATLRLATTLSPTSPRAVPVAFGYHPYVRLPGVRREEVALRLPPRRHLELDDRRLPTGADRLEPAEDGPLGTRAFDDLYELGDDRRLVLRGGGRRLTLWLGAGYRWAQVFAPPDADYVCLEPMTAPVNALVDGGYSLATAGAPFTAEFTVRVQDDG